MINRKLFIIYILLFIKICFIYSKNITISAIIFSFYDLPTSYYNVITKAYNEYSKENNIGITVDLTVIDPNKATADLENYGTTIDSLLMRKKQKYDVYFFFSTYTKKYDSSLLNLEDYLPKESIEVFDKKILKEGCSSSDNKIVALPVFLDISTLFSNQELLTKYGKEVPKTWDELIETGKYIYDEEKNKNNTIIPYHSSLNEGSGSAALYEFITSFKESNASPFPDITSKETYEAMKKIKEMKNVFGKEILNESEDGVVQALLNGNGKNFLFIRFFYMLHVSKYKATALPGKKKGVSGTFIKSMNIAIGKNISEERKEAAAEYLKFVALKDTHRKYIINGHLFSPITDLYDEEEVCSVIECEVVKDSLPYTFENNDEDKFGNDNYITKFRDYLFDYIYKDKPLDEVIKKIDDMTKKYQFLISTNDSNAGLVMFIVFLVLATFIILSIIVLFSKKFEKRFRFLSRDFWIITVLGSLILMCSMITLYGKTTTTNCHLRTTLINVGFVLSIYPSLHKLITNFPVRNKFSLWFEKNKYISFLIIMIFTGGLNGILAISSFDIDTVTMSDGRLYEKCIITNTFGSLIFYLIQIYDIFIILISLILIFMEWNLEETSLDIKYLATALFMDTLSLILLMIMDKIKFDYVVYNVLLSINILFFAVSNYVFTYLVRVLPTSGNNEIEDSRKFLGKVITNTSSKKFSVINSSVTNSKVIENSAAESTETTNKSRQSGITQKVMSIHNRTSISLS